MHTSRKQAGGRGRGSGWERTKLYLRAGHKNQKHNYQNATCVCCCHFYSVYGASSVCVCVCAPSRAHILIAIRFRIPISIAIPFAISTPFLLSFSLSRRLFWGFVPLGFWVCVGVCVCWSPLTVQIDKFIYFMLCCCKSQHTSREAGREAEKGSQSEAVEK